MSNTSALTVIGGVVGGVIGYFAFGGNVVQGAQYGAAAGAAIGGIRDYNTAPDKVGPRIGDTKVIGSAYGAPLPVVYGAGRIAPQVAWAPNKPREIGTTSSGKGSGPKNTTYTYESDYLFLLTANQMQALSRVWLNGKLIWTNLNSADAESQANSADTDLWRRITFYSGSDSQLPDPTYEAAVGVGNAPAYRGRSSVFIEGLNLGTSGQLPNLTFEVLQFAEAIPNDMRLYSVFAGGSTVDRSPDALGAATQTGDNLSITDGLFSFTQSIGVFRSLQWQSVNLRPQFGMTYELIFKISPVTPNPPEAETYVARIVPNAANPGFYYGVSVNGRIGGLNRVAFAPSSGSGVNWAIQGINANIHFAFVFRANNTLDVFCNGFRQATVFAGSSGSPGQVGVMILGGSGQGTQQTLNEYYGVRVSAAEVYPTSDFTPPTELSPRSGAVTQLPVTLRQVVEAECSRAGMLSGDFDAAAIAAITKPVRSIIIGRVSPARGTIEQLMGTHFFVASNTDKLRFAPVPVTPVATIDIDELGCASESPQTEALALTVGSELELPPQVSVRYVNVDNDYQDGNEISDRLINGQKAVQTMEYAIGMKPGEAKAVADANLIDAVAALTRGAIATSLRHAYLEPGDVINVRRADSSLVRLRLGRRQDAQGVLQFEVRGDDASALVSAGVTDESYVPSAAVLKPSASTMLALDIPLLRDADDGPGYYVAAKPTGITWPGAQVFSSINDVDFDSVATVSERAVFGTATTALGNFSGGWVMDEISRVTVNMGAGELSSTTREELFADSTINALLIGNELVRFANATLDSADPNIYTLSRFLRGQNGTEWAISTHGIGERVALLRPQGLRRVTTQQSDVGALRYLKAVTLGQALSSAESEEFTSYGVSQKPLAPVNLRAAVATGGGITLTWDRRSRMSAVFLAPSGLSLGESAERYVVDLYDDGDVLASSQDVTAPLAFVSNVSTVKTYNEGVSYPILDSGSLFGVQVEGSGSRSILKLSAGGALISQSFTLGELVYGMAYDDGKAYISTHYLTTGVPQLFATSILYRVALSDLGTIEASYTATAGDLAGLVHDGVNCWSLAPIAGRLNKHNATTLAVDDFFTVGTDCWRMAKSGDVFFVCFNSYAATNKVVAYDTSGSPTQVWGVTFTGFASDVVHLSGLVFVATNTGVLVLDASDGSQVHSYTDGAPIYSSAHTPALTVHAGNVIYRRGAVGFALVRTLNGSTGDIVSGIDLPFAGSPQGSINGNLYITASPTASFTDMRGYEVAVVGSLAGYTVKVAQVSAAVGRGYEAEMEIT